ncbi:M20/M25/M40 family metallo-hydrolase [Sphingomonas sp. SRS2]|uniref:M20/M25/M40 family metallo-hydrolase n=1 Tax=Sphingomonas sp. SRS2 TaxID=133190 RepID=UPI00128E6ECD|nr:M20/M25/M40 family metallo-hydrolase [Sphingomonas sp. SRS2]
MLEFSKFALVASAALSFSLSAQIAPQEAAKLRDAALTDSLAWEITEGLTTEIGPRFAGSEAEARARDWAVAKLKALGFANVRIDAFDVPYWERGEAAAEIVAPFPQPLTLAALGNSGATPPKGLKAQVVGFDSIEALQSVDPASIKGKIVFVTHRMAAAQDGSHYGPVGLIRRSGPSIASKLGAAAILIRSIGTDNHRVPHTGSQNWTDGARPIPALALSNPDADQLERVLKRGQPVTIALKVTAKTAGTRPSGNVIAEVPGRDPAAGIVLVSGHLDSWDLGTGAIDDAAGVAVTAAAAKRIMDAGQPLRTIRVVWFGAEEIGLLGGKDYALKHGGEKHHFLAESDFGADRIWRFETSVAESALPRMKAIGTALAPLGVVQGGKNGDASGSDISEIAKLGMPVLELSQDGTRYFDLHHTSDDTLDKIDPVQLRQNVAAWTAMLAVAANDPVDYGPVPPKK